MASSLHLCVFLCLASGLWAGVKAQSDCPPSWKQYGNACYKYNEEPRDWFEAEGACSWSRANLVSIHTEKKYDGLKNFIGMKTDETTEVWLGGIYHPSGEWLWNDGTSFVEGEVIEKLPAVRNGCMEMNHFGEIDVADCNKKNPYICVMHLM